MLKFHYKGNWSDGNYVSYYYISTYPDPKDPERLVPVAFTNSCREFFVRNYRTGIVNGSTSSDYNKKAYALTTYGRPKASVFDEWNIKLQDESQNGLYILNSFEKAHKWPLTKLYPVECTNMKMPAVFFAGPRKWTMSPYLMSIWSLCIRLGRNNWLPKRLLTLDHENMIRQLIICANTTNIHDARQVKFTLKKWDTFLSLYFKLFGGIERKEHWSKTHLNGVNDRPEGIAKLMDGTTGYRKLYEKYTELLKEVN
jgi:hypothetical protein